MIPLVPTWLLDRLLERKNPDDRGEVLPPQPEVLTDIVAPLDEDFFLAKRDVTGRSNKSLRIRKRQLKDITAAVTHQTAVVRKPSTLAARAHLVICHVLVGPDGLWYLVHPLDAYLYAADLANRFSVSVEFSGNFEGHPGEGDWYKPEKFGRSKPTEIQIHRGRQVIRWLKAQIPGIQDCVAHRQFRTGKKEPKELDPGWQVYQGINLWAEEHLGLHTRPDWTLGNGSTIPNSWLQETT